MNYISDHMTALPIDQDLINALQAALTPYVTIADERFHAGAIKAIDNMFRSKLGTREIRREKRIKFISHRRQGPERGQYLHRWGYIDIYANDGGGVAIEVDSGTRVKWKSWEKLIQCDAQTCIGIALGPANPGGKRLLEYSEMNVARIHKVSQEQGILFHGPKSAQIRSKNIWLGLPAFQHWQRVLV